MKCNGIKKIGIKGHITSAITANILYNIILWKWLIRLSNKTMRKMNENLLWATGYNVVAIPIAAGVLVPYGIVLDLSLPPLPCLQAP